MKTAIKIIFSLTILIFCGTVINPSVQADTQAYEQAAHTLVGLNILEGYEDGSFGLDKVVKRAEFVAISARILGMESEGAETSFSDVPVGHWAAGAIEACRSMGIVSGHSETIFGPDEPLSYDQAVKVLITVLGYDLNAEEHGGYPLGYSVVATQLGLTKNTKGGGDDILKRGVMAQLIYNALHSEEAETVSYGAYDKRVVTKGVTLLSSKLNIITGNGIMEGTSRSRLSEISDLKKNQVEIDGKIFETDESKVNGFLGYNVTYYAKESKGADNAELLYVVARDNKNTTQIIRAEDILKNDNAFSKTFFVYMGDREERTTLKVSPYADLIYNGVSLGSFMVTDMCPADGMVTLLDNNNDGVYEVIFVTEYETIVVSAIGDDDSAIYDLYDKTKRVDLTRDSEITITKDGKEAQLASIQKKNILLVAKSKNTAGTRVIEILVSDTVITGVLSEMIDEDKVIIEGEEYTIANNLQSKRDELKIGMSGTFYLTSNGKLAAFEEDAFGQNGLDYGYLIGAMIEDNISSRCIFKMLSSSGTVAEMTGAAKIMVDGGDWISDPDTIISLLKTNDSIDQIIKFSTNKAGEINKIDTIKQGDEEGDDGLKRNLALEKRRYMSAGSSFGVKNPDVLVDAKTKVFLIPTDKSDFTKYRVAAMSYFKASEYYTFEAYDMTDAMVANVILIPSAGSEPIFNNTPVSMITSITNAITDSGEITHKITVYQNGSHLTYYGFNETILADVTVGEFVRIGTNADGKIDQIPLVLNPLVDELKVVGLGSNPTYFFSTWRVVFGVLEGKEDDALIMSTGTEVMPYKIPTSGRVSIFKYKTQKFSKGTIADIEDYVHTRNTNARVVVIAASGGVRDVILMDLSE